MSAYWYAVNDERKEYVFLVGQSIPITREQAKKLLTAASIDWTHFRLVCDSLCDEELCGYTAIEPLEGISNRYHV